MIFSFWFFINWAVQLCNYIYCKPSRLLGSFLSIDFINLLIILGRIFQSNLGKFNFENKIFCLTWIGSGSQKINTRTAWHIKWPSNSTNQTWSCMDFLSALQEQRSEAAPRVCVFTPLWKHLENPESFTSRLSSSISKMFSSEIFLWINYWSLWRKPRTEVSWMNSFWAWNSESLVLSLR